MSDYLLTTHGNRLARGGVPDPTNVKPMANGATAIDGCMVAADASGNARGTGFAGNPSWIILGICARDVDNSSNLGLRVEIEEAPHWLDNDSTNPITEAMIERSYCYAVDNHTVGSSDLGGTLPTAGVPTQLGDGVTGPTGKVLVRFNVGTQNAANPNQGPTAPAAFTAHVVATNLAALTFTGGTFSFNANGALATQDGVVVGSMAVGDVIVFPAGTITTGSVSAANSGPWLLTSLGGASAKVTGIRPDWWPHGGNVPSKSIDVKSGTLFSNTSWRAFGDTGTPLVIGTDDPKFCPRQVTQQVTLSSGTKTISNVPIADTTRLGLGIGIVGGTPDATTTGYNFRITSGRVAGGIGTAAAIIDAQATAGGTKVSADVAVLNVTLFQG